MDSFTRIVQILAFTGVGALVGALVGLSLRFFGGTLSRRVSRAQYTADNALLTAEAAADKAESLIYGPSQKFAG